MNDEVILAGDKDDVKSQDVEYDSAYDSMENDGTSEDDKHSIFFSTTMALLRILLVFIDGAVSTLR